MRIAFAFNEQSSWLGGSSYYDNLLSALKLVAVVPKHRLIGISVKGDMLHKGLQSQLDETYEVDYRGLAGRANLRLSAYFSRHTALAGLTPESGISRLARNANADVVFLKQDPFANFRVPSVCWFPDFQYLHMPEMFPPRVREYYKNTAQDMARYATRVLLSSQSALEDFQGLFPEFVDKVRLVPFAAWIDDHVFLDDPEPTRLNYHLPERFFYLPNQFWYHKNHRVVLDALELVSKVDREITIVSSGGLSDFRNPHYFSDFEAEISRRALHENFIILGVLPRNDVYALARASLAVLQPSLFEGWSTSVEEAKSLGKRVILSGLPVHHEQIPQAGLFFDPNNADELASLLLRAQREFTPGPDRDAESAARQDMKERVLKFGQRFIDVLVEAAG